LIIDRLSDSIDMFRFVELF